MSNDFPAKNPAPILLRRIRIFAENSHFLEFSQKIRAVLRAWNRPRRATSRNGTRPFGTSRPR